MQKQDKMKNIVSLLEKRGLLQLKEIDAQLERIVMQEIRYLKKNKEMGEETGYLYMVKIAIDNFSKAQEYGEGIVEDMFLEFATLLRGRLVKREDTAYFDSNLIDYYILSITKNPDDIVHFASRILKEISNYLFKCIARNELEKQRKQLEPLIKTDVKQEIIKRMEHIKNEYVKLTPSEEREMMRIVRPRAEKEKEKADEMFKDIVNAMQRDKYEEVFSKYADLITYFRLDVNGGIGIPSDIRADEEFYEKLQEKGFFKEILSTVMGSAGKACGYAQEKGGNCIFRALKGIKIDGEYPCVEIK